jgi:hypothetical protein
MFMIYVGKFLQFLVNFLQRPTKRQHTEEPAEPFEPAYDLALEPGKFHFAKRRLLSFAGGAAREEWYKVTFNAPWQGTRLLDLWTDMDGMFDDVLRRVTIFLNFCVGAIYIYLVLYL